MRGRGGVHGRGVCVTGGHAWWGACMAGGVCDTLTPPPTPQADTTATAYGQ